MDRAGREPNRDWPGWALLAPALLLGLGGCGHRDAVETPAAWWHHLEGGRIAEDRPPPPGLGQPYPLIGTTPTRPPELPAAQERIALTNTLVDQRNAALRRDADNPLPAAGAQVGSAPSVPAAAKPAAAPASPPPADPQRSQLVFAASTPETAPPAPPAPPAPAAKPAPKPAPKQTGQAASDEAPEIAMPELQAAPPPVATNAPMPDFAPAPPAIPWIHGITITRHETPKPPDIPALVEPGTDIAFDWHADTLQNGEGGQVRGVAGRWRHGTIVVHGYGDAVSAQPDAQVAALALAWRRAKLVAGMLVADGVPQGAVRLAADAFGHDARIVENP